MTKPIDERYDYAIRCTVRWVDLTLFEKCALRSGYTLSKWARTRLYYMACRELMDMGIKPPPHFDSIEMTEPERKYARRNRWPRHHILTPAEQRWVDTGSEEEREPAVPGDRDYVPPPIMAQTSMPKQLLEMQMKKIAQSMGCELVPLKKEGKD